MKFTDHVEKVGSAGARSSCSMLRGGLTQRAPVIRSLRSGLIAQDSSVNDQTRFTMRRSYYGPRSCIRNGSQHVLLLCELWRQLDTAHVDLDVTY